MAQSRKLGVRCHSRGFMEKRRLYFKYTCVCAIHSSRFSIRVENTRSQQKGQETRICIMTRLAAPLANLYTSIPLISILDSSCQYVNISSHCVVITPELTETG